MTDFSLLEQKIKIKFNHPELLKEALTHRSYLNEHPASLLSSNERLEFLGDAILEFLISEMLFNRFPHSSEGILTASRSQMVQTKSLAQAALKFDLGSFLLLSKGEEEGGGRQNLSLLENAFEALIGAIFLDQGLEKTKEFVFNYFDPIIKSLKPSDLKDAKSLLQEITQEKEKITPVYKILSQEGPDHAKIFSVAVYLNNKKLGEGRGPSKRKAEEEAAKETLKNYVS